MIHRLHGLPIGTLVILDSRIPSQRGARVVQLNISVVYNRIHTVQLKVETIHHPQVHPFWIPSLTSDLIHFLLLTPMDQHYLSDGMFNQVGQGMVTQMSNDKGWSINLQMAWQ